MERGNSPGASTGTPTGASAGTAVLVDPKPTGGGSAPTKLAGDRSRVLGGEDSPFDIDRSELEWTRDGGLEVATDSEGRAWKRTYQDGIAVTRVQTEDGLFTEVDGDEGQRTYVEHTDDGQYSERDFGRGQRERKFTRTGGTSGWTESTDGTLNEWRKTPSGRETWRVNSDGIRLPDAPTDEGW